MPKYRKKPVIISAQQWHTGMHSLGVCYGVIEDGKSICMNKSTPHIHTLEGEHIVSDGDYIITGVKGEKYPCKPDIFEMTYDLVPELEPRKPLPCGGYFKDNCPDYYSGACRRCI